MARAKKDPDHGYAVEPDPADEVVHVEPKGSLLVYRGIAYGEHATLQVRRRDLDRVEGDYEVTREGWSRPRRHSTSAGSRKVPLLPRRRGAPGLLGSRALCLGRPQRRLTS